MSFSDLSFLFRFLPVFLPLYAIFPPKWRPELLILASLAFVGFTSLWSVPLLLGIVIVNWALGREMARRRTLCLGLGIAVNLALLAACRLTPMTLPGVSYLVFSLLSYLIDRWRGGEEAPPDQFGAWAVMFPRLVAGPIARWSQLAPALERPAFSARRLENGLGLLILGLGYKVLLADRLSGLWALAGKIGYEFLPAPMAWLCAAGFSLQLYYDFHGCCLMAVGLGEMLGFRLPENFNFPYVSRSVGEFYRRWHITLGTWFRDYVYIPLGGSRQGMGRTLVNLLAVWLLTGLWHGLGGNFLLWGLFLFCWIALEKLGLKGLLDRVPVVGHLYLLPVIVVSWVIFAVETPGELLTYLARMFGLGSPGEMLSGGAWVGYLTEYLPWLICGVFFALPFGERVLRKYHNTWPVRVIFLLLFWASVARLSVQSGTPFLYARF